MTEENSFGRWKNRKEREEFSFGVLVTNVQINKWIEAPTGECLVNTCFSNFNFSDINEE